MDDPLAARLRAQEAALREVLEQCARARDRVAALGQATGWRGLAGDAYRLAGSVLDDRITTAYSQLLRAANDTAAGVSDQYDATAEATYGR